MVLRDDEVAPTVTEAVRPEYVVWSSLWPEHPDARLRFDLAAARGGTDLRWTLYLDDPLPEARFLRHLFQRIGELINAKLRYTYGQ